MTDNVIYVKELDAPPIDRREVLRYAGVSSENAEIERVLEECIAAAKKSFSYKVCYRKFNVSECDGVIDLGFCRTVSDALSKSLLGCKQIILFAATVGFEIDRLIARSSVISPAKAVLLQALGTERVEALCDAFCNGVKAESQRGGIVARPRVSAGYGDIPLAMQRDIFSALDLTRKIGVTLSESLLMSPSKSVTAIIGLQEKI